MEKFNFEKTNFLIFFDFEKNQKSTNILEKNLRKMKKKNAKNIEIFFDFVFFKI